MEHIKRRCEMQSTDKQEWTILRNEEVQINLFLGDNPYSFGHIVVQPMNGGEDISKLGEADWMTLSKWIPNVTKAMKRVLKEITGKNVKRIYLCSFNESKGHPVHFHLVPRYEDDMLKGPNLLFHRTTSRLAISGQERDTIVHTIRKELLYSKRLRKETKE